MATRCIQTALVQNAGQLGLSAAQSLVKAELENGLKIRTILTEEQLEILHDICYDKELQYDPSVSVTNDHVILVAIRELVRREYARLIDLEHCPLDALVVGATSREYRQYKKFENVSYWFFSARGSDVTRTVIHALKEILIKLKKKAKKSKKSQKLRISTIKQLITEYSQSDDLPAKCYAGDEKLPKTDILLLEDTGYFYSSERWCRLFHDTQATVAYGYMMLPYELNFPDIPANPLYSYYTKVVDGKLMSVMNYPGGYSNGYVHETKCWNALATNIIHSATIEGKPVVLQSEVVSRFGPYAIFKLNRANPGDYLTRTIELPEHMRYVYVLDIYGSVNKRTGRIQQKRYFTANEREVLETQTFLMNMHEKTPVTMNDAIMYIRRRMGGIGMINKTLSKRWHLKRSEAAMLAWAMVLDVHIKKTKREFINKNINPTSWTEKFYSSFRQFVDAVTWPAHELLDWLYSENLTDQIIVYPRHGYIDHKLVRVNSYDNLSIDEVLVEAEFPIVHDDDLPPPPDGPSGPGGPPPPDSDPPEEESDEDDDRLETAQDFVYMHPDQCHCCSAILDSPIMTPEPGKILQRIKCDFKVHKHRFLVTEERVKKIKANLIESITKCTAVRLADAMKMFYDDMPASADHTCQIEYLEGGPGCGKSVIIRELFKYLTKTGLANKVIAPFAKLADDYSDTENVTYYFKTTHRILRTEQGEGSKKTQLPAVYGYLFVDEFTGMDYEAIALCAAKFQVDAVFFVGDIKQTGIRESEGEGISCLNHIDFSAVSTHKLTKNFRNPPWVVRYLDFWHNYDMIATKTEEVPPIFVKSAERKAIIPDKDVYSMYFSKKGWLYYHPNESEAPTDEKYTVRSNQGSTHDNVALYIAPIDQDLAEVAALEIVALSRHRNNLYIVYNPDDARSLMVATNLQERIAKADAAPPIQDAKTEPEKVIVAPKVETTPVSRTFTKDQILFIKNHLFQSNEHLWATHLDNKEEPNEVYWEEMKTAWQNQKLVPRVKQNSRFFKLWDKYVWLGKKVLIYGAGKSLAFANMIQKRTGIVVDVFDIVPIIPNGGIRVLANVDGFPVCDVKYDMVIFSHVLHHMNDAVLRRALISVQPHLKFGGGIHIVEHDYDSSDLDDILEYVHRFYDMTGQSVGDCSFTNYLDVDLLRSLLLSLGYDKQKLSDPTGPMRVFHLVAQMSSIQPDIVHRPKKTVEVKFKDSLRVEAKADPLLRESPKVPDVVMERLTADNPIEHPPTVKKGFPDVKCEFNGCQNGVWGAISDTIANSWKYAKTGSKQDHAFQIDPEALITNDYSERDYAMAIGNPMTLSRQRTSNEYSEAINEMLAAPDIQVKWNDPILESLQSGLTMLPEKPPSNAYMMSELLLPEVASTTGNVITALNELESRIVPDDITKMTVNLEELQVPLNNRGNVDSNVRGRSFRAYGLGYGKTFVKGDGMQTLGVIAARYDNKQPAAKVTSESHQFCQELVEHYFATYKNPNALPFDKWLEDDAEMAKAYKTWIDDANMRHYFEQYTGSSEMDIRNIRFHLKRAFKPDSTSKPIDLEKAGQGISPWNIRAMVRFGFACRVIAAYDRYTEENMEYDVALTDAQKTDANFLLRANLEMRAKFPTGVPVKFGIGDFPIFDGTQEEATRDLESIYNKKLGIPEQFVDEYTEFQDKMPLFTNFGVTQTSRKTSGAPWTLYGNSTISKLVVAFCLIVFGPSVFLYKGDDTLMVAPHMELDKAALARVEMHLGLKVSMKIGAAGDFCGMTVSQDGIFPDVYRKLLRITGTQFRDLKHFQEYQVSIRDSITQMKMLGVNEVVSATALNRDLPFEAANAVFHIVESFSHIGKEQFEDMFPEVKETVMHPEVDKSMPLGLSFQ